MFERFNADARELFSDAVEIALQSESLVVRPWHVLAAGVAAPRKRVGGSICTGAAVTRALRRLEGGTITRDDILEVVR